MMIVKTDGGREGEKCFVSVRWSVAMSAFNPADGADDNDDDGTGTETDADADTDAESPSSVVVATGAYTASDPEYG